MLDAQLVNFTLDFVQVDRAGLRLVPVLAGGDVADGVDLPFERQRRMELGDAMGEGVIDTDDFFIDLKHREWRTLQQ